MKYFSDHPTTQVQADDAQGTRDNINALAPLKVRILAGKEEEIYWQTQEKKKERFTQVRQTRSTNRTPKQEVSSEAESSSTSTAPPPKNSDVAANTNDNKKTKRSEKSNDTAQPAKKHKNTHVHFS
jgi:hypothetical protein